MECRKLWAWKHALCALHSFRTRPPDYHLVLHPPGRMPEGELSAGIGKWMAKLKRLLGGELEYARVFEWQKRRVHAHVWLRTPRRVTSDLVRRVLPPAVRFSCERRRGTITAAAKYLFKDVRDAERKTQLPPSDFRGKLFTASRKFFTRPIKELWKEVRAGMATAARPRDAA